MSEQTHRNQVHNRVNPPACQSDEECPKCSFALHCHEQRVGMAGRIGWPGVMLAIIILAGVITAIVR